MPLTVIIVMSGFIGRYIYTRIPRALDGIEVETQNWGRHIACPNRRRVQQMPYGFLAK